ETATHIGIREAEDWFRPIDLTKECDIYISSKNGSRAHAYAYPNVVSVSNLIENSSYDLPHVKNFNTRNDSSSLIKDFKYSPLVSMERKKGRRTAVDSVQSEWPLWHAAKSNLRAQAQLTKTRTETFELVKVEQKL
ncbi:hypothetical protein TNCV_2818891, partial [Trichonephila clavipes]